MERHYFVTPQDKDFPEDRFCAECGKYFTHKNHLHARECHCMECEIERGNVHDMGEVNSVRLTYVGGNVFATPKK